ncbi:hypothetical protein ACFL5Y_01215 [Candidatus Omnitrophota bacterium]
MKNFYWIIILLVLFTIAGSIICHVFETPFAEATIDWFSFLAGIFLITEGTYKILTQKVPFFPDQLLRTFRIVIGTCVFTIHLLQFMRF